jgi:hypothetical protein
MARKTTTLMGNSGDNLNLVGDPMPGDSYYGYTDGLHTIAIYGENLSGRVRIQGTLSANPTENDWFNILLNGMPYKDYNSFTGVEGFTFTANLVFLRAILDRDALGITDVSNAGYIEKIYLNY